ncbi:MAG: type II toxin-antitoxin system Phd/YefM family antitoxin [Actinomycetota bacterium]
MKQIPQRELRNESGRILREAEAGEEFTVTVDGRPVAVLSGYRPRRWLKRTTVEQILKSPTDETLFEDLVGAGLRDLSDPWERS